MFGIIIIFVPKVSSDGVVVGLLFCSEVLIPSLFPFMALSSFIVYSGVAQKIGSFFKRFTNFLFFLPDSTFTAIILGLIGGYPAGAKCVKDLFDKKMINEKQAQRVIFFAIGAGPAFVINVVGTMFLRNIKLGAILLAGQILSIIFIGIALGIFARFSGENLENSYEFLSDNPPDIPQSIIKSCESTGMVMINMCALVVFFSVLISILEGSKILNILTKFFDENIFLANLIPKKFSFSFLLALLEVTQGCARAAHLGASPELFAFLMGWGGICVHFQVKSILRGIKFSYLKFMFFRLIQALGAASITHFLILQFKVATSVFKMSSLAFAPRCSSNAFGSTALIFLCVYFLINFHETISFESRIIS
jgi:sporulation integral membrane protein YlbJ